MTATTETLTFLFTDVEGSTRLWERHPAARASALARHDALLRTAIEGRGGRVFKTVGDAFCAAFACAPDALAAALDAQRALMTEPWGETGPLRVRMALDSGAAEARGGDYFGPPLNRVARLLAAGHGGQVLLLAATQSLLESRLPRDVVLRNLGNHRLKDLGSPERVFQVAAPGLPAVFPKLRAAPAPWTGAAAAATLAVLGLALFPLATGAAEPGPDLLAPRSLLASLTGLVVELSSLREHVLLAVASLLLLATATATAVWWRGARVAAGVWGGALQLAGQAVGLRTVAFLGVATLAVLGAYAYQQYLWRVALPIPDGALGIALTREAAAASLGEELAYALQTEGPAEEVVVRELPIAFNAEDVDEARALGRRIGAEAVLIYREDEADEDGARYVAYMVFTDPDVGWVIGRRQATGTTTRGTAGADALGQARPGVTVPTLRAETAAAFVELMNAAAGIVAYHRDRFGQAVAHLERARTEDPDALEAGIIEFYLGNAYRLSAEDGAAAAAYERAIAFYERHRQAGANPGPQDELVYVQALGERGALAAAEGDWDGAVAWYERGVGAYAGAVAAGSGLERPEDVHATFARLYARLADAHRAREIAGRIATWHRELGPLKLPAETEAERHWRARAADELRALTGDGGRRDAAIDVAEGEARFALGDCVGALAALERALDREPGRPDASVLAAAVLRAQNRDDLARARLERLVALRPDDVRARLALAEVLSTPLTILWLPQTATDLAAAEAQYRAVLEREPANVAAREGLADIVLARAQTAWPPEDALHWDAPGRAAHRASYLTAWQDPAVRDRLVAAYSAAIEQRRVVAVELRPGDPAAQLALAMLHAERLATMVDAELAPPSDDGEEARAWSAKVLAEGTGATRAQRLWAWSYLLSTLEHEARWQAHDGGATVPQSIAEEYRRAVAPALSFAGAAPVANRVEARALAQLYGAIERAAVAFADATTAATAKARREMAEADPVETRPGGLAAVDQAEATRAATGCAEVREVAVGGYFLGAITAARSARRHYEASLAINPGHVDALSGLGWALYLGGDVRGAVESTARATQLAPDDPLPWLNLGLYHLAAGDGEASAAAYARFFELMGKLEPLWGRSYYVQAGISDLGALTWLRPELRPPVVAALDPFARFLDGMAAEADGAAWHAHLYYHLGVIALDFGDAAAAERYLRRALELDPHDPWAGIRLALAVLAQGRDATAEIETAVAAARDPYWRLASDIVGPADLLSGMEQEVSTYLTVFPTRSEAVGPLRTALDSERKRLNAEATGAPSTRRS